MICESCGDNIKVWYEIKRMRMILWGAISYRFGAKYIENVCANCITESVVLFTDYNHSVNIEMFKEKKV
jgi:hypothetical protein